MVSVSAKVTARAARRICSSVTLMLVGDLVANVPSACFANFRIGGGKTVPDGRGV